MGEALQLELITEVREDFTITEKASSWLKAPASAFTFKTLLRHYPEHVLTHGKKT